MAAELVARRTAPLPAVAAGVVVALQIAYPLAEGSVRDRLTIAIVVLFAATCVLHAGLTRGGRTAVTLLVGTAVPGFAAEVLGRHTGVPFGSYTYSSSLGPRLFDVPMVVAFAWTMLAWPAAVAARRLVRPFSGRVLVGAWALASADLFLDPQMVAAGHWRWDDPTPHLPGVPDVPLTNNAGWLLLAVVLSFGLQRLLDRTGDAGNADDTVPVALYLWLYAGWVVALAGFLDLAAAAAWGAAGMGLVAVPLALRIRR